MKHRVKHRNLLRRGLPCLLLTIAVLAAGLPAFGQSSSTSPGRYRSQGSYRSQGHYRGQQPQQPWQPSYYHQNKYYEYRPSPLGPPYTGNLSRSNLEPLGGQSYAIGPVIYPTTVVVPSYAPEPPPAPAPQIIVLQPAPTAAPEPPPPAPAPVYQPPPPPAAPVSKEPGELALSVRPADTAIYLNDHFLGTGETLATQGPLLIRAGVYVLEAEHPDYETQRLVFAITADETSRVVIDLAEKRPGRRARVAGDDADFLVRRD